MLIANPHAHDPFFERTVVLVWHHDEDGAIGVVINRATDHTLGEVLQFPPDPDKALDLRQYDSTPVVWGGPVERGAGTVVAWGSIQHDEGWTLPDGVAVTRSQPALLRLLASGAPLILCLGYAGWGAGQLDQEIQRGDWLWTDIEPGLIFKTPPEKRYTHALATLGLTENMVWMQPIDE
jgi:putative transcriptional regulator